MNVAFDIEFFFAKKGKKRKIYFHNIKVITK